MVNLCSRGLGGDTGRVRVGVRVSGVVLPGAQINLFARNYPWFSLSGSSEWVVN